MKHPNCHTCKTEILKDAYTYQKYFFCREHFIEAKKGGVVTNKKEVIVKSGDVIL